MQKSFTVFLALLIFLLSHTNSFSAEKTISVGAAKINITPSVPIPMSGYGSRKGPFTGVHDELFAKALVFDNGTQKAAIIGADVIGFSHDRWDQLTSRIEKETGIPKLNILLSPVHNHGGPVTRVYGESDSPDVMAYNAELDDKLVDVVKKASQNIQPAHLGFARGECKMNMNRRARNAKGGIRLGKNPTGPCDHSVEVIRIDDLDKNPIALFVNWPCHATTMGGKNETITGDWPGATARFIKKELGEQVVVLVTAGASGNIDPIYRVKPDFNRLETEEIGIVLGKEVVKLTQNLKTLSTTGCLAQQRVISLPGKKPGDSYLAQESYEPGPDKDVRLSVLKIGHMVFAGVSGEAFTQIGQRVKELSPYKYTTMITHCNGSSGYLVTDDAYPKGGYEVKVTRVMSGAEKEITKNLLAMINGL
jgi:neutral ceramidase